MSALLPRGLGGVQEGWEGGDEGEGGWRRRGGGGEMGGGGTSGSRPEGRCTTSLVSQKWRQQGSRRTPSLGTESLTFD